MGMLPAYRICEYMSPQPASPNTPGEYRGTRTLSHYPL